MQTPDSGTPTDIGRVTAGGDESGGIRIAPSGTGTRAQAKAAEHKAINKILVQPQSEIQKLPDVSIAQALSRLPGISLETDSGEGRFIDIRGLDADLNATTFDGVRILPSNLSSPTGGGRAVAYDVLPAGLVGGIEVSETLRPEDDAEGLGGLVNLLPRRPRADGQPFLNATAGLGLQMLRDTQILDYGITVGASFGLQPGHGPFDHPVSGSGFLSNPKPFSFLITTAQHNDYRGVDDFEPSYSDQQSTGAPDKLLSGINLRHYLYNRRRFDHGGEFDFDPNDTDHFFVRYAVAGYNEHAEKDFLNFNGLDSGYTPNSNTGFLFPGDPKGRTFLSPQAVALRTNTDTEEELRNQILEAGGRDVVFDTVKIDYHGAYSEGTDKFPTAYGARFSTNPFPLAYNNQVNSAHFLYNTLDGTNLLNQSIYGNGTNSDSPSSARDREYSGAANVTVPFQLLTPDDEVKFGAVIRLRDRIVQNSNSPTVNLPGTLADYTSGPSLIFYNGDYNIGPSINAASVNRFVGKQGTGYDPTAFQHDTENVYAGYAQYGGSLGKLSWLAGVRLESTFGVYRQAPGQANAVSFSHAYTSYFPSVQLKYDVTPAMDVRAVYSSAIGRPGFQQISPGASFNPSGQSVTIGNPNLSPEYADAFDLFWEYYLPRGGKVSAGGFDKEFNTFIFQNTLNAVYGSAALPVGVGAALGIPATLLGTIVPVTTYQNSGPSRVYGIEAEYTQQFLFLPAPFDGFGIDSNMTYNQSSARITRNGVSETLQQPQTSPWNFNASVFYEKDPVTFRLAANYVSKDLYSLGGSKQSDVYVQQRFRLDLGTAYQVTKNIQLYFDAHNLTDQTLKYTETASVSRPTQRGSTASMFKAVFVSHTRLIASCVSAFAAWAHPACAADAAPRPPMPRYEHVFVIVEENQGLADILDKPFTPRLTALAKRYGIATQYYGVVHPSEGNYVAMIGGDTFGIHDDDAFFCKPGSKDEVCKGSDAPGFVDHTIAKPSLADQLAARNMTWRGYYESLPAPGATDIVWPKTGNAQHLPTALYASKHNSFNAFASAQNDPQRSQHIVNFEVLGQDLILGTMPNFAQIVPNQCNEMHGVKGENVPPDCAKDNEQGRIARGDAYAGALVDRIMSSPVWSAPGNTAIVVTFDEASHHIYPGDPLGCCAWEAGSLANFGGGRIATIVIANHGPRALQDATPYNHYSLLRTLEDAFGIAEHLGHAADEAKGVVAMQPLFAVTH